MKFCGTTKTFPSQLMSVLRLAVSRHVAAMRNLIDWFDVSCIGKEDDVEKRGISIYTYKVHNQQVINFIQDDLWGIVWKILPPVSHPPNPLMLFCHSSLVVNSNNVFTYLCIIHKTNHSNLKTTTTSTAKTKADGT